MKKLGFFLVFLFLVFVSSAQGITETRAKELFGERFISAKEAGLSQKIPLLFEEKDLKYDHMSWLIPISINGLPQYKLIQARYLPNDTENNDTLTLKDAEEVIRIVYNVNRNFPNEEPIKFFKTKDKGPSRNNLDYQKTIVCKKYNYEIIDIPERTSIVLKDNTNYISFLLFEDIDGSITIMAPENVEAQGKIFGFSVMTLISIKK